MDVLFDSGGANRLPFQGPHWGRLLTQTEVTGLAPLRLVMQPSGLATQVTRAEVVVGRHSQADIRLPLADVSRQHCRLVHIDGKWHIFDLDSLNGLYINGTRVHHAQLMHRDVLRIGGYQLEVDLHSTTQTVVLPATAAAQQSEALRGIAGDFAATPRKKAA